MSDWKIEAVKADPEVVTTHDLLISCLYSQRAWRLLSKTGRTAVEAAYPDAAIEAHPLTIAALERHGFIVWAGDPANLCPYISFAGLAVAKWCVKR